MRKKILHPEVSKLFDRTARLGLSTFAIEKMTGVHHDVIGKWRRGETVPNMGTFAKVLNAVDLYEQTGRK